MSDANQALCQVTNSMSNENKLYVECKQALCRMKTSSMSNPKQALCQGIQTDSSNANKLCQRGQKKLYIRDPKALCRIKPSSVMNPKAMSRSQTSSISRSKKLYVRDEEALCRMQTSSMSGMKTESSVSECKQAHMSDERASSMSEEMQTNKSNAVKKKLYVRSKSSVNPERQAL
ncbi:hypothetical protein AVEN_100244-1 [Araneus ventricosus]|uniref:Uncharacterized protein n=1 Tax=Araneus ventricosus TaxID=182803 RepID=A0A4Y2LHT9_ARAVE|nr:hypothetical protein AVEN_100244-1 [Araneus ventricosus]